MNNGTQLRGYCQSCGNVQAVKSGHMSLHGYTVKDGWFKGVCSGNRYAPMQESREHTDAIIAEVSKEVQGLRANAADLENGTGTLGYVEDPRQNRRNRDEPATLVLWTKLDIYDRATVLKRVVWGILQRAKSGDDFVGMLQKTATAVHGTSLLLVERPAPTAPIQIGECRKTASGSSVKAIRVDRHRAYWQMLGEKPFRGWTGTKAWRSLTRVEGVA